MQVLKHTATGAKYYDTNNNGCWTCYTVLTQVLVLSLHISSRSFCGKKQWTIGLLLALNTYQEDKTESSIFTLCQQYSHNISSLI